MNESSKQHLAQQRKVVQTGWNTLKDKAAFDALTTTQKTELLRQALIFLMKQSLKNDVSD